MQYLVILFLVLLIGFIYALTKPHRHFLFLFCLSLYFIYLFMGPLNTYTLDFYTKFGTNYELYFNEGLVIYILATFTFIITYIFSYQTIVRKRASKYPIVPNKKSTFYLLFFFLCVAFIVFRKMDSKELEFSGGLFNYLLFFSDSLLLAFTILFYENKMKKWMWFLFFLTIIFYLILGFRYRVILILVAFIYHIFITNNLSVKTIIKWASLSLLVFVTLNFISLNRNAFRNSEFSEIRISSELPDDMTPYQFFLQQTDNYATDFSVLKNLEENVIDHDYGNSMFYHIAVRIIPADYFNSGEKPVVPQQEIIRTSFGREGYFAGSAATNIFEYYIAFGYVGVIFFMTCIAYIISFFSKTLDLSIARNRVIVVMLAMILFQEITRGYLPQTITLTAFLIITLILFYKRLHVNRFNKHPNPVQNSIF